MRRSLITISLWWLLCVITEDLVIRIDFHGPVYSKSESYSHFSTNIVHEQNTAEINLTLVLPVEGTFSSMLIVLIDIASSL